MDVKFVEFLRKRTGRVGSESHTQNHPSLPSLPLRLSRLGRLPWLVGRVVPHDHDCATQSQTHTHSKSSKLHHACITHRSRFTLRAHSTPGVDPSPSLSNRRLHRLKDAALVSTPRPLPATSLYEQSTYQRCTSQAAHPWPQAAPRTQCSSTTLLWRPLVPIIYMAFTSLRALALLRTCPFASLPDGILDSDGCLPMAPGLTMPEGCFSIAAATFLPPASASG